MLAIRLQRLGRKGYPVYRIAVQEAQRHPTSGRVVAYVGSYNPHTKLVKFDKEKIELYLKNGAQPSPRVVKLMVKEKISLPAWVSQQGKKTKQLRHPDKLRKNQAPKPVEDAVIADDVVADEKSEESEDKAQSSTSAEADSAVATEEPKAPAERKDDPEAAVSEETDTADEAPKEAPVDEPKADDTAEPDAEA